MVREGLKEKGMSAEGVVFCGCLGEVLQAEGTAWSKDLWGSLRWLQEPGVQWQEPRDEGTAVENEIGERAGLPAGLLRPPCRRPAVSTLLPRAVEYS